MTKISIFFIIIFNCLFVCAQEWKNFDKIVLNPPTKKFIEQEIENNNSGAYKIGTIIPTNITVSNSGDYNNNKWCIKIFSEDAIGLSLHFEYFNIQEDSEFIVYDKNHNIFNIFKKEDNLSGKGFSIGIVGGDEVFIEYKISSESSFTENDFKISGIAYIYRRAEIIDYQYKALGFGSSESCFVNVNCSEGNNLRQAQKAVARVYIVDGNSVAYCSGTLINNTAEDGTAYFLTAAHCATSANAEDYAKWRFDFNFESVDCTNPTIEPIKTSFTGCKKIASAGINNGSDFLLVLLTNITINQIKNAKLVFNGWNITDVNPNIGYCISHPMGDIKKVSTFNTTAITTTFKNMEITGKQNAHWKLKWSATQNGYSVTDIGSSGSPLLDNSGKIIATLSGGNSSCSNSAAFDYFGKIFYHWDQNSNDSISQLKYWLDPLKTNTNICKSLLYDDLEDEKHDSLKIFPNPCSEIVTVKLPNNLAHKISIFNSSGQFIRTIPNNINETAIDISNYKSGIYFFKIENNNKTICKKLIKR